MKMVCIKIMTLLLIAVPATLLAETCADFKKILAATEESYRPLQGGFDFFFSEHRGTVVPSPFTECFTKATAGSSRYRCWVRLPDDESRAKRELASLSSELERCFGPTLEKRSGGKPDRLSYRNLDTGESISLSVARHVPKNKDSPPRYTLHIRVSNVDLRAED